MRLLLVLCALLVVPVSGCFQCVPQLDVRNCAERIAGCDPTGSAQVEWNPDLADLWPDVARLVGSVPPGMHAHADWTTQQAEAFWTFYQVPPGDGVHRQVFLTHGDGLFRVRVIPC